jgi:DNA mismatch repair protein MutL
MTIRLLPADVAAKIAAGEVVERPANVVKELLENAIDAGATEIRVEMREGGRRQLRVSDNGYGIPAGEVLLAFERHATSKLSQVDDLLSIGTFGFRGEALYSIAAVSRLTLTTCHRDENAGVTVELEGGVVVNQSRAGVPVGTVVNVEHLFFNVPARLKFLRSPAAEAGQIAAMVQRMALAYPERRFSLIADGRLTFQSTGSGDLLDVIVKVNGLEVARQMVRVGSSEHGSRPAPAGMNLRDEVDFMGERALPALPAAPLLAISGAVSQPLLTRPNRSGIDLFVNRRYIEDRTLTHAVVQSYHAMLPVGRYPMAYLFIEIDPAQLDVNVHPQKTQVRFVDERRLYSALQKAVRRAVIDTAPIPGMEMGPGGEITPARSTLDGGSAGSWSVKSWYAPVAPEQQALEIYPPVAGDGSPIIGGTVRASLPSAPARSGGDAFVPDDFRATTEELSSEMAAPSPAAAPAPPPALGGRSSTVEVGGRTGKLPPLRVVGQVGAIYIVAEGPEGLFLIDQHAAHERILYEKMMEQRYGLSGGEVAQQQLLEPLTLHVGHALAGQVADQLPELLRVGFGVEAFGSDTFLVRAVPSVLAGEDPLRTLEEIVAGLGDRRNLVGEELEARLVKMVCKRAAIKAGQPLSVIEMQELVRQLEECQSPRTCPHGRPTMIQLSAGELEKAFGRV